MPNLNYASEYSRALANAYPYLSYFGDIWASPLSTQYKPGNGKTVYIPSMSVTGARAVNRDSIDGNFQRNYENDWEPFTLDMDREWDTLADPMDIQETNMVGSIANITRTFNETQKVPEMDAYLAAKLASAASAAGNADTTVLTKDNILTIWDGYLAQLTNARVPRDHVTCKVTPEVYALLKQAAGITRFVDAGGSGNTVDRRVGNLDGVIIREVPKDLMMTEYNFAQGWKATDAAKQINMLLADVHAVVAPVMYDTAMTSAPTAQSKGKWLYFERYYYGAKVLKNRTAGVIANVAA